MNDIIVFVIIDMGSLKLPSRPMGCLSYRFLTDTTANCRLNTPYGNNRIGGANFVVYPQFNAKKNEIVCFGA